MPRTTKTQRASTTRTGKNTKRKTASTPSTRKATRRTGATTRTRTSTKAGGNTSRRGAQGSRKAAKSTRKKTAKGTRKQTAKGTRKKTKAPRLEAMKEPARISLEDSPMVPEQFQDLMYQALETEMGGLEVYQTALRCAQRKELKEEWREYRDQTRNHRQILTRLMKEWGMDPDAVTPGRLVVRANGEALVGMMEKAASKAPREQAQIVAAECVLLAETKDHMNWELLAEVAKGLPGEMGKALKEAVDEVSHEEGEHLYHTMGWARELWLHSLGLPAVMPPPEEVRDVQNAGAAERAQKARKRMLRRGEPVSRDGGGRRVLVRPR